MDIKKIKKRTFEILEKAVEDDNTSRLFDIFIIILIILNILCVILETVNSISLVFNDFFRIFEIISVAIFTIEYLLRVWTCTINDKYKNPIRGRIKYMVSPMALIDLFAILPFYIPKIIPVDLRFIRAARLFRLFRIFKIGRYSKAMNTLKEVVDDKKEELLISLFGVVLLLVIASSLMYYVEGEVQPDSFSSIPAAMWWGVATLTTVGYGDIYPITVLGKILGAIIALLGIGMFALPAGILASGFAERIQKSSKNQVCPHCGKAINKNTEEK